MKEKIKKALELLSLILLSCTTLAVSMVLYDQTDTGKRVYLFSPPTEDK